MAVQGDLLPRSTSLPIAISPRDKYSLRTASADAIQPSASVIVYESDAASKSRHRFCVKRVYADGSKQLHVYHEPRGFDSHYGSPPFRIKQRDL